MHMSVDEVKAYWQDFCRRHKVAADLVAQGNAKIEADPDHWADHTMWELLEAVGGKAG